jgi:YHS domain-containing protein
MGRLRLTNRGAGRLLTIALCLGVSGARGDGLGLPPVVGAVEMHAADGSSGLALRGFDPVSFQLPDGPRPGRREHEVLWSGVAWRFASAANRDAFERHPEIYAPRLGGYDAIAAARGLLVAAEPEIFAVRGGRLYLFRTAENRARFGRDPALAAAAEARWPDLRRALVQP